jgi:hypothetical protein
MVNAREVGDSWGVERSSSVLREIVGSQTFVPMRVSRPAAGVVPLQRRRRTFDPYSATIGTCGAAHPPGAGKANGERLDITYPSNGNMSFTVSDAR